MTELYRAQNATDQKEIQNWGNRKSPVDMKDVTFFFLYIDSSSRPIDISPITEYQIDHRNMSSSSSLKLLPFYLIDAF